MKMRKFIVAAATAAACTLLGAIVLGPVLAADKGGSASEATLDQLIAKLPPAQGLYGCHVELSGAGLFLSERADRPATVALGGGCDVKMAQQLFTGVTFRGDWGDRKSGETQGKVGLEVNPSLHVYPFLAWRWDDWAAFNVGTLHLGAGAETKLGTGPVSAFVEGSTSVAKAGPGMTRDDVTVRFGLRVRIGQ